MKKIALLLAISTMAMAAPAAAQVVGSNDNGNCYPFNCNDSGTSVGQSIDYYQIYSAAEFSGLTSFSQINFFDYVPNPGTVINGNYLIEFGTTTSGLNSSFPVSPMTNVSTFFNGLLSGPSTAGVFSITGNLFNYNPADGNLVMRVLASNQDLVANGSGNGYFAADYTGSATTRAYLLTNSGAQSGVGALVTEFVSGGAVPEPATWALMVLGVGMAGAAMRRRQQTQVRFAF